MALKDFVLGKLIRRIEEDPVYKNYYCYKITDSNDCVYLSPVMDHRNMMTFHNGLVNQSANRKIKYYELIASGLSEDEASDLYYQEQQYINESLKD